MKGTANIICAWLVWFFEWRESEHVYWRWGEVDAAELIESIPGANAADVVVVTVARTSLSRTFNSFWRLCFVENVTSELSSRLSFTLIDLILVSYSTTSFLFFRRRPWRTRPSCQASSDCLHRWWLPSRGAWRISSCWYLNPAEGLWWSSGVMQLQTNRKCGTTWSN